MAYINFCNQKFQVRYEDNHYFITHPEWSSVIYRGVGKTLEEAWKELNETSLQEAETGQWRTEPGIYHLDELLFLLYVSAKNEYDNFDLLKVVLNQL